MEQLFLSYIIVAIEILAIHSIPKDTFRRNYYFFFFFLQLFILAGFRRIEIPPDTLLYDSHFTNVSDSGGLLQIDRDLFNIGYLFFERFVYYCITKTVLGFNLITSFIICFCTLFFFYRKAAYMGIAVFLYFVSGEYFTQVAVLRESIAVMLSYFFFYMLTEKRYYYSILFILLAISFHNSAFVLFGIFFLEKYQLSKKMLMILFVAVVCIAYAIAPFLELMMELLNFETKYFTEGEESGFMTVNGLFNGIIGILVSLGGYMMIMKAEQDGHPQRSIWKYYLFIYLLISVVTLRLSILSRYLMFFNPIIFVLISNLIFVTRKNIKYAIFMLIVFSSNIVIKQIFRPEWVGIFPYGFYNDSQLNLLLY